jgi:tetrahydromethanopterin S-methyltransferase subunit F
MNKKTRKIRDKARMIGNERTLESGVPRRQ